MFFLAVLITAMWGRFILMLTLTRTFGPMLRIIIVMITDVLKFMFIWIILVFLFTSVASLVFGSLDSYSKFIDVCFTILGTSAGNYDLTVFKDLTNESFVRPGQLFLVIVIIVNAIIMINFIIAILADTYSKYMKSALGLYYDGVIQRIPLYEDDNRYGGLIIGSPPFNVAAIVLVPFYFCIEDERRLISINEKFNKAIYAPIALLSAIFFAVINILLMPLAYIVAMFTKITLLRSLSQKQKQSSVKPSKKSKKIKEKVVANPSKSANEVCKDLIVFILFGLPFLLGA